MTLAGSWATLLHLGYVSFDLNFQHVDIGFDDFFDKVVADRVISVHENVTHLFNFAPGRFAVRVREVFGQFIYSLADDFNQLDNSEVFKRPFFDFLCPALCFLDYPAYGLGDMSQPFFISERVSHKSEFCRGLPSRWQTA